MADTTYSINIQTQQGIQNLNNLQNKLQATAKSFEGIKTAIASIAIGGFIANAVRMAAALDDMSKATGISTKALMGFSDAIAKNGGDSRTAIDGLGKLSQAIEGAAGGSKELQDKFLDLGISLKQLGSLSEEQLLRAVVDGLARVDDNSKRASIGMALFGKSFRAVDYRGVAGDIDAATTAASRFADSQKAAADAEDNFNASMVTLQRETLAALKPISEMFVAITENTAAVGKFIKLAVEIGSVVLAFTLVGKAVQIARAAFVAISAGFGTIATAATITVNAIKNFGAIVTNLGLVTFTGALRVIGNLFSQMGSWALASIPGVAALGVAMSAFSGYVSDAYTAVKEYLGFSDRMTESQKALANSIDAADQELGKAMTNMAAMANSTREVEAATRKEALALDKLVESYQRANEESAKKYRLETEAIGQSESAKNLNQARYEAETNYLTELNKLLDQYKEKMSSTSPSDQAMLPQISAAMGRLTQEYERQYGVASQLAAARTADTRANELRLTQIRNEVDVQSRLRELQAETAKVLLPEIQRKYLDIESAARASAEASIASEEARRNEKLNPEERKAYYDSALKGIESLKSAQLELNRAQEAYNLQQFGNRTRIDSENELIKIQNEIAKSTLPAIEQKYYDIAAAARASAKAAIDAEEQRRNAALTPEEARAYYDEALKGTEELAQATRLQYESSRSFSTGWAQAFNDYADNATNAATTAKTLFGTMTKGMEDLLVNFAKTGKFEWKNFLASMLEALLKAQIQSLFAKVLGVGGAGGSGSILGQMSGAGAGAGLLGGLLGGGGGAGGGGQGGMAAGAGMLGGLGGMSDQQAQQFMGDYSGGYNQTFNDQQAQDFMGSYDSGGYSAEAYPVSNDYGSFGGYDEFGDTGFGTGYGYGEEDFGGYFARGGRLGAGKFGIAGESGPELISGPANITPMQGLGTTVTYNINALDAASFKQMIAQDPTFLYAVTEQGRKSLPGAR